jgi:gas vesicle protein
MNKTTEIAVAFAAGAAAGLIAGILLAPGKGADTRKRIVDAGKRATSAITEMPDGCKKEYANGEEA